MPLDWDWERVLWWSAVRGDVGNWGWGQDWEGAQEEGEPDDSSSGIG